VSIGKLLQMFWRNVLIPSSQFVCFMLLLDFEDPEVVGNKLFRNAFDFLPVKTASYPSELHSLCSVFVLFDKEVRLHV
jgi:hypothetical protein